LYVIVTTSLQKDVGIKALFASIELIKEEILKRKGQLVVKVAPRTVHERDEKELTSLMAKLERQNRDQAEDEDADEEDKDDESEEDEEEEAKK